MKGFLTFTLAAGVAITTTSIAQAAGVVKGPANASRAPATAPAPMGIGAMGISLDRTSLARELDRLNAMLNQDDDLNLPTGQEDRVPSKMSNWTY